MAPSGSLGMLSLVPSLLDIFGWLLAHLHPVVVTVAAPASGTTPTAVWAAAATTAGVLVALGVAVGNGVRDTRARRRAELREACNKVAAWATAADSAIRAYEFETTKERRHIAIETSNQLPNATVHLLMIEGLKAPIRRTIDAAGMRYIALIQWIEKAGSAGQQEWDAWETASVKLVDELRELGSYS